MLEWNELFEPYGWDDHAAVEDAVALAERIDRYAQRQGVKLTPVPSRLARQILEYVWMRQTTSWHEIAWKSRPAMPVGWTARHEQIWTDWIWHVFELEDWRHTVMDPVFGTDVRSWESACEGWREELFEFLPHWIARSLERFEEIDVTPLPDPEPEDADPRTAKIDPYLLEHARRGRRIKGMRTFD